MATTPVGVWLKFDSPEDEEPSHEASIDYDPDLLTYAVSWSHTAVGLVTRIPFTYRHHAERWLREQGYADFTTEDNHA